MHSARAIARRRSASVHVALLSPASAATVAAGLLSSQRLGGVRGIQYKRTRPKRDTNKPIRSVLFTPGCRPSAMKKALSSPADVLTFDLEDSVAPDRKHEARELVRRFLETEDVGGRSLSVRVNPLGSQWWTEDIALMAQMKIDAIVIPKVNNADTLITANELLTRYGAHEKMAVWAMIETPHAVMNIKEIAQTSYVVPRLECLMMGTSDLTNDLHARHTADRSPLLYSLSKCVVAARAFRLRVIDGVYLDLNDPDGFKATCAQGRALGFDGKSLIHPKTVEAANDAFGPLKKEIEHAQKILSAWEAALKQGQGVAVVDGRLVEALHVDEAQRMLALQRNIEASKAAFLAKHGDEHANLAARTGDTSVSK